MENIVKVTKFKKLTLKVAEASEAMSKFGSCI